MEKPTRICVVEDELLVADNICATLKDMGYEVAEPSSSYSEAVAMIEHEKPDLVLLDIRLAGQKDGIDLAWTIRESYDIPFIFLTANADSLTVERAKKVDPPAYLVKPFNKDELFAAIEIALFNYSGSKRKHAGERPSDYIIKDAIFIKNGQYYQKVKFDDILFLESDHIYVNVKTVTKTYLVRTSMQEYMQNFDPERFVRVHRSYVVNMSHVERVEVNNITLAGVEVPVGRTYRDEILSRLRLG